MAILVSTSGAFGASSLVTPAPGYAANDFVTSIQPSGFDVFGGQVAAWDNLTSTLSIHDKAGGAGAALGAPADYLAAYPGNVWNSFVKMEPGGASVWAGFTTGGSVDDRIYQVDLAGGAWTQRATMPGNFDVAFHDGRVFAAGLNSGNWADPNCVWLLDVSGANRHDLIATLEGWSTGLDIDASGNLYAFGVWPCRLLRYSRQQVAGAIGAGSLALADAEKLSDLGGSPYDVATGADGQVAFTINGAASEVGLWNGLAGDGLNYGVVATGAGTYGWDWFTFVDAEAAGICVADGNPALTGLAEIVPEPAALSVLALGAAGLLRRRRA